MTGPLNIDLNVLADGPVRVEGELVIGEPALRDAEACFVGPAEVSLTANSTNTGGAHLIGRLSAGFRAACRLCLIPLERRVDLELDLLLEPAVEPGGADDAVYPLTAEGGIVDLAPTLREELLLATPEFLQCREDCKGLCSRCGSNLNESTCDCVVTEPDPRWEVLRKLRA